MKIIGISGGSGSGKSTVAYKLVDDHPDTFEVLNFDDYQKADNSKSRLPTLHGMINWDHPDVMNWGKLLSDIKTLQSGNPVTIQTWAHRSNPDYFKRKKMIHRTIYPKKKLIIEGYLTLWNKEIRDLCVRKYYLDVDNETSLKRRNKFVDPVYDKKVLGPMHKKYVEPTKKFADLVLDANKSDPKAIADEILKDLPDLIDSSS